MGKRGAIHHLLPSLQALNAASARELANACRQAIASPKAATAALRGDARFRSGPRRIAPSAAQQSSMRTQSKASVDRRARNWVEGSEHEFAQQCAKGGCDA